ncbi:MAG: ABC transporter ATP-binding protein [candidate division NC10 bacterium]|nr:ABC transporter ATP-binding protein [candidate division NC10 bacterium]
MMLAVEDLHVFYGESHILQGVSFTVEPGEVCCLLGRNGAGKSTTLKSVVGFVPPRAGRISFRGVSLVGLPTHRVARLGVGYVPEDRRIFPTLTVAEHLRIAARGGNGPGPFGAEAIYRLFPCLRERAAVPGRALSGGEQQMLAIGRALVGNPALLLLDEPSEGLGPLVVAEIRHVLAELKGAGLSTLLVEQNLPLARALGDRFVLLSKGRVVFHGGASDLRPEDARRYLGV